MNGKIDASGKLHIERSGSLHRQMCPFAGKNDCGDWCPQFGEPIGRNLSLRGEAPCRVTVVQICHSRLLDFDELIDERGERNERSRS